MNIKKKIKHIVRWFTPYGVVRWHKQRHHVSVEAPKETFMNHYRKYIGSGQRIEFAERSPFKTVVSVQGFGYSGSGAVVDLLREYDSSFVIGNVDNEGSVSSCTRYCEEVDILRLAGGLFEVERFLGSNNIFQNDALLHRVITQIENAEIYRAIPETRPYFYEYLNRICEVLTDSPKDQYYNTYLYYGDNNDILYLKDISLTDYRDLCRKLLNSLFAVFKGGSKTPILVLDQFFCDFEFDMERYLAYIPNLKLITVYRDPRDVYSFAQMDNVEWIPHQSVDAFIHWNNIIYKNYDCHEQESYLAVRFEKLIDDYESVVDDIEKYIGVDSVAHTKKGSCINPSVSRKNMFLWKLEEEQKDYEKIARCLPQLCYDKF